VTMRVKEQGGRGFLTKQPDANRAGRFWYAASGWKPFPPERASA